MKGLKLALVHEWLINIAGSEKVSAEIYRLFKPDVFTLLMKEEVARELFPEAKVTPSFLQRFPKAHSFHRFLLPLFPLAVEQFNLSEYNVIISSSHAVAKGVLTRGDQLHICYCHTPMRYAWDLYHQYTNSLKGFKKLFSTLILHYIRIWDSLTANRVDHFIANSKFVARRIKRVYGKEAKVIYPPVEVDKFSVSERREDYYITVSRFVPYKRVDVVIEAFKQLKGRRLVVVGDGPQFKELKKLAGRNVEFTGKVNFQRLKELLQKAKAFIFAAEEDFGIAPVEAQACGVPVIAYGRGGALETVVKDKTGIFFHSQTPRAVAEAVKEFEQKEELFDPRVIRKNAERFSASRFRREIKEFILEKVEEFKGEALPPRG